MAFDRLRKAIAELRARIPKATVWYLADGSEFCSDMTGGELVVAGFKELDSIGPYPILDAAMQTVRSSDGSKLHELFRAAAFGPIEEHGIATPVSPIEAAPITAFRATDSGKCLTN